MSLTGQDLAAAFKKRPISLGSALAALVFGAATYYRSAAVPEMESLLEQRTTEGERLKNNIKYSALLDDQLAALMAANRDIQERSVRPVERAKNYQYFYKMEADTGVKLLDLRQMELPAAGGARPGTPPKGPKPTYVGVPYSVAVQGTYPQVLNFLRRLESGLHFCRLLNASVSTARNQNETTDSGPTPITLSLTLELLGTP
ncbi:MAG TPA: hypothetical protein VGD81_14925 [Opitutaceae bacterium]